MKKKFYPMPYYIVNAIAILIVLNILVSLYSMFWGSSSHSHDHIIQIDNDPDSLYIESIRSLPYNLYIKKADSINRIQSLYRDMYGNTMTAGVFGIGEYPECDTCNYTNPFNFRDDPGEKYYFILSGFKLPQDDFIYAHPPVFYKKLGVSYMRHLVMDTAKWPYSANYGHLHWVDKVIHYRVQDEPFSTDRQKLLLIPLSRGMYVFLDVIVWIVFGGLLVLAWLWLRKLSRLLSEIAKGNAFTVGNYQRLYYMAYVIALVPGGMLFIQMVLQLAFRYYYAGDVVTDINWGKNIIALIAAIAVFMLARAFQRGYYIQQEQDLTI